MKAIVASSMLVALLATAAATGTAWAGDSATVTIGPQSTVKTRAGAQVVVPQVATGHAQTAVACNFCFTCGGDWPVFAGQTALGSAPFATERGSGCAGSGFTTSFNDGNPFLCCR